MTKRPTSSPTTHQANSNGVARMWTAPMTTPTTPLMTIRLTWKATNAQTAKTMMLNLEDMMRGAHLSALRPAAWTVSWRVFQGASEVRPNPASPVYGVALWVHPSD